VLVVCIHSISFAQSCVGALRLTWEPRPASRWPGTGSATGLDGIIGVAACTRLDIIIRVAACTVLDGII
jgi:hypothetical protein